jgi:hypothetical protein
MRKAILFFVLILLLTIGCTVIKSPPGVVTHLYNDTNLTLAIENITTHFVPYHGAINNTDVGSFNITASWFFGNFNWIVGDFWNSFDGHTLTFNETKLNETIISIGNTTYVPYTGAINNVNVGTFNITASHFFGDGSGLTDVNHVIWTKDLILDMPFQAGSPTKDYSAYQNHGIIVGDMVWDATGGYNGFGAYEFDNVNDRIKVPDSSSLDLVDNFTFSAWIYPNGLAIDYVFMRPSSYYLAILNTGVVSVDTYTGMGWGMQVDSTTSYTVGEWNHIMAVIGLNGDTTIYINGEFAGHGTTGSSAALSNNDLTVGGFEGGSSLFNGYIDEPMIWNRSFTALEARNIYDLRRKEPHFNELIVDGNITADYFIGSGAYLNELNVSGNYTGTGDINILGYYLTTNGIIGAIGGMNMAGDPWWIYSTDVEIDQDLKVNNTEVENNLIVGGNVTASYFNGNWNGSIQYVPYTGALQDVDLGSHSLETTGNITAVYHCLTSNCSSYIMNNGTGVVIR